MLIAALCCILPFSLNAQWLEIDGLPGGSISKITQGQHTVFTSGNDATWRSTDDGENWEKIPELPLSVTLVADGANVLASRFILPLTYKCFQSADDGFTWTEFVIEPMDSLGSTFQIFGTYIYARKAFGSGTYRTYDHGTTWEFVSEEEFDFIPDGGKMYRSVGNVLLESSNGGFLWDTLSVLPSAAGLQLKQGAEIVATNWPFQGDGILYYSKDAGGSWTTMSIPTSDQHPYDIISLHQDKIYAFRRFSSYAVVADLSNGVFQPLSLVEGSLTGRSVISAGEKLLRATLSSGVTLSSDGGKWHKAKGINSGGILQTYDGRMYATPGTGLYRLQADKQHWELIAPDFELRKVNGFSVDGNYITLVSHHGNVWVSSNGGQTFEPGKNEDGSFAQGIYRMEEAGGQLFGWDYGGLRIFQPRYSDNHGLGWKSLSPSVGSISPTTLAVSNGHLYLCDTLNLLYRWNPSVQTFEQISTTPIPFAGSKESKFTIFVKGDAYIVVEPEDHFLQNMVEARYFVSADAGQSWTEYLLHLWHIECSGDTIFAALESQVSISTTQADTWQPFSEGIEGSAFWLEIFDGEVFASTANALYRRKTNGELPTVPNAEPGAFSGFTVSPNPFSDHFSIQLAEPKAANSVRLFDILGQTIELPNLEFSNAEMQFSGLEHLPHGVYFLEIEINGSCAVEKLMKF